MNKLLHDHLGPDIKGSQRYTLFTIYGDMFCMLVKEKLEKRKFEKISSIEHFKETARHWKNYCHEF